MGNDAKTVRLWISLPFLPVLLPSYPPSGLARTNDKDDRKIEPGTDWTQVIDQELNKASIILLLVSADFLASNYRYNVEMQQAMEVRAISRAICHCKSTKIDVEITAYYDRVLARCASRGKTHV
ncbi:toll/interleukin-1 receptor domain-containing protein [Ktedonobacter robiniae]|uniref:TIR domain-containing protein n=1 Tax=Ktedonobacter robiniae TaxID=2778365 RepID=A0ABQ3US30_9CHLR|nr:toll/interleukin-1 receptor domain-containing protein [Ktedonobacter robiniae]GHO55604.1 hypothetical protein KSB_40790 [Ktedonobacter robiniae]